MSWRDLFQPRDMTAGETQIAFEHASVYQQLNTGNGPETLSNAALELSQAIVEHLDAMDQSLNRALSNCQAAWKGDAANQATQTATPLTTSVWEARDITMEIGNRIAMQTEHFAAVRTMPPPKEVQPLDLGIGGYTPGGFLVEQVDKEIQERQANAVEEAARQQYTTYQESTSSTTGNLSGYAPVPKPLSTVSSPQSPGPGAAAPNLGHNGDERTSSTKQPENHAPASETPMSPDWLSAQRSSLPSTGMPNETNQAGSAPLPAGQALAPPGPSGSPTSGPSELGSDKALPAPGHSPGAGRTGGGSLPRGRAGSLVHGPGMGSATPGGRPGNSSPSSTTRGVSATGFGGALGGAQRGQGAEDEDHERKYIGETDEHFQFDGEIDPETGQTIAPPVFGGVPHPEPGEQA